MPQYVPKRITLKFQHWIVAVTVILVLVLSGAFLWLVFSKFSSLAELEATENFNLMAEDAVGQIRIQMANHREFVTQVAAAESSVRAADSQSDAHAMLPLMMQGIKAHPGRYSVYFGYKNDDFVQVIRVDANPAIVQALQAPPDTDHAIRHIRANAEGNRVEYWSFFGANNSLLGKAERTPSYRPTARPWYQDVMAQHAEILTEPYIYASSQVLGLTFAAPTDANGVFGVDVTLSAFDAALKDLRLSPHGGIVVLDEKQNVLALRGDSAFYGTGVAGKISKLGELGSPYLREIEQLRLSNRQTLDGRIQLQGKLFIITTRSLQPVPGHNYSVYMMAPLSDFTVLVEHSRNDMLILASVVLLLLIPLIYLSTQHVVRAFSYLARNSENVRNLDFSTRPKRIESCLYEVNALGLAQEVMHNSIMQRTHALNATKKKMAKLVEIGIMMGRETDYTALLRHILHGARDIAESNIATLFLRTERNTLRTTMRTLEVSLPMPEFPIDYDDLEQTRLVIHIARTGETINIADLQTYTRFDTSAMVAMGKSAGLVISSALCVPLIARNGEVMGVLSLLSVRQVTSEEPEPFAPEIVGFTKALATQSAVALNNQNLIKAQKDLMNSIIQLVAGAVDAKSAYTGGHCDRVPQLAFMLAEEVCKIKTGPLADFDFHSEEEWYEFRVGAWLHDCGKVTTPEYVVDKATKLETIYNRIHEVRVRFEVLLRDAEIATRRLVMAGGDKAQAWADFEARKTQLLEDFAFIAEANIGDEYMTPEMTARMRTIASQTWLRHFDDHLGLAHGELSLLRNTPKPALPAVEALLADKPGHFVPRPTSHALDPKHGFKMKVPELLYNRGEIHNLSIPHGTLTEEERFKVNEHIIQTIVMLDAMPFPRNMRRVPEYAGTHHETLTGTGYPRQLDGSQMSVPARIMAIADIFEALTASDRPYKKAKTLSESIEALSYFKKNGHIDATLFDLFLTSGLYRTYGERFLDPEQLDEVDIAPYLTPVHLHQNRATTES